MKQYHLQNRPNREIKLQEDINRILINGKFAVISMCMDNEPYIVTLSYGFDTKANSLYFHCATKGLKLDFLKSNKRVCATVIEDGGYITNECAHEYKSVVFWGNMQIVNKTEEKRHGMNILLRHLEDKDTVIHEKMRNSEEFYPKMEILRLDIQQIHAKAGR